MKKQICFFLLITFAIMLLCWGACMLCSLWGIYLSNMPLLYVPYMLGGFSPTIASLILFQEKHRFRRWLASVFDFRHNLLSYLLIVLFAGVFFLVLCVTSRYEKGMPLYFAVFMIPFMLFGGGLEETGWRGFLQPELEKKFGYTVATIATALVWWVWHLPLFYIQGVAQYGTDFFAFGLNVLALSFGLSTIKKVTGSTWLCVLFHSIVNTLHSVYIIETSQFSSTVAASALILFAYLCLWVQKKKSIFR